MNQLPAYLANRRSRGVAEALQPLLTTGQPPHISIRQNRFRLVDAAGNEKMINELHLDVVVVGTNKHMSKIFYKTNYDPDNSAPPDCWSDNGVAPSSRAASPQSDTCAVCAKNVWGSDVSKMTGKPTKACNDVMKLAVIVPSDDNDLVYLLRIPPATLKNLGAYVKSVAGNMLGDRRADPSDVVTRLSFDAQTQGVLNFAPVSLIDQQTCEFVDGLDAEKQIVPVVGGNDVPIAPGRVQAPVQGLPQPVAPVTTLPPPAPAAQGFSISAQQEAPAPKKRGPKPKPKDGIIGGVSYTSEAMAAPAPAAAPFMMPQADNMEEPIPAFLQRKTEPATPTAPLPPAPSFGLSAGAEPDAGLAAALNAAFNLPTK